MTGVEPCDSTPVILATLQLPLFLLRASHGCNVAHTVQHDTGTVSVGLERLPRGNAGEQNRDIS